MRCRWPRSSRLDGCRQSPGCPGCPVGVTNWRGRLLAVVDLGPLLGGPKTAVAGTTRLLLVSRAAATLGVLADSVDGVGPVTGEPEPAVGTLRADAWVRSPKRSVVSSR